eukprot:CAMPEP_0204571476 /NCGR_PEP_ID=MMETSP0661-20131031/38912_1 /ASSEMBLY_ACC=CAM_ASM_000606 /TAXON_ID=109239 /ORGANISM="Alexandrium margalefi, Strain AMGDE01CS-322" /LENGTH=264 /DNA_ID=CAMNT_0051579737 /DNA_START=40 /DNA_END=834 /DNA_ORIENTATION=+
MAPRSLWLWAQALVPVACAAVRPASDAVALLQKAVSPARAPTEALDLEEGDKAEIVLERGAKAGTWAPCTVLKNRSSAFYDVRVALGPNDRYETHLQAVGSPHLRRTEDPHQWEADIKYYQREPQEAKQVIRQLEKDAANRVRTAMYLNGANKSDVQAKMAEAFRRETTRKEQAMRVNGCPAGYQVVDGDARGGDHFGRNSTNRQDTLDLCAAECNEHPDCHSFEWSIGSNQCNLNKVSEPDRFPHFADYLFCKRSPMAQAKAN